MVQVIDLKNQKGKLAESLGLSLGKGLGNALNTHFANRSLDSVLHDKALQGASPSKKMEALRSALSPYGEKGQEILGQRMLIQQQEMQEEQNKKQEALQKMKGKALGKYLNGGALTEDEQSMFTPQEFVAMHKAKNPKQTGLASERAVPQDQLDAMKRAHSVPGYEDMSESDKYQTLVDNGVSPQNSVNEAKLRSQQATREDQKVDSAYKAQKDFIDETTSSHKGFETEMKPRLLQMQHMKPEDIVSPTAAAFLEAMHIPLGALEDPSSELYNKLSQDLLKGLPETYGNRILRVEVENFLKTIPTLLNSPDGRRMIASNMLKLGEMKEVYYNAMRDKQREYTDSNKPLPRDFQQVIFDQVKPQIDRINNEFIQMSDVKSVPEGTIPFFSPDGNIKFVPKDQADWASKNGGRRIW